MACLRWQLPTAPLRDVSSGWTITDSILVSSLLRAHRERADSQSGEYIPTYQDCRERQGENLGVA